VSNCPGDRSRGFARELHSRYAISGPPCIRRHGENERRRRVRIKVITDYIFDSCKWLNKEPVLRLALLPRPYTHGSCFLFDIHFLSFSPLAANCFFLRQTSSSDSLALGSVARARGGEGGRWIQPAHLMPANDARPRRRGTEVGSRYAVLADSRGIIGLKLNTGARARARGGGVCGSLLNVDSRGMKPT